MKMYKIINDYQIRKGNSFIPRNPENMDYLQFVDDIYEQGIGIVEGADYVGLVSYTDANREEYPPIVDQLDKIYHSGVDAWKADIKVIKDKYPKTQVGITSIASLPDWVNTALFEKQKEEYIKAVARLAQNELADGKETVIRTESVWDADTNSYVDREVMDYVIQPLPLIVNGERNPLIVQDETERAAAQTVINNTPQAVIDSINT